MCGTLFDERHHLGVGADALAGRAESGTGRPEQNRERGRAMTLLADLEEFVSDHRPHGTLTPTVGDLTPNGDRLEVACDERSLPLLRLGPLGPAGDRGGASSRGFV